MEILTYRDCCERIACNILQVVVRVVLRVREHPWYGHVRPFGGRDERHETGEHSAETPAGIGHGGQGSTWNRGHPINSVPTALVGPSGQFYSFSLDGDGFDRGSRGARPQAASAGQFSLEVGRRQVDVFVITTST